MRTEKVVRLAWLSFTLSTFAATVTACDDSTTSSPPTVDGGTPDGGQLGDSGGQAETGVPEASADAGKQAGMLVDGVSCPIEKVSVKRTAPNWELDLVGNCPVIGRVDVLVNSNETDPYPQTCGAGPSGKMTVGDVPQTTVEYTTSNAGGSCTVSSGPTAAAQATPVEISGTFADGSGATKTLVYVP